MKCSSAMGCVCCFPKTWVGTQIWAFGGLQLNENVICTLLSSDTPKSLMCTTNWLVNEYILTWRRLGVFGWYCWLEGKAVVE